MMTDHDLAVALQQVQGLEDALEQYVQTNDVAERDHAHAAFRMVRPLRRALVTWISLRSLRAQLQPTVVGQ